MESKTLLVTLNDAALNAVIDEHRVFDIGAAVAGVPSLRVVEGDPSYSLVVTIEPKHIAKLQQTIGSFCVLGEDAVLDLY